MAVSGVSQALSAVGAYDSQAQAGDAQKKPPTTFFPQQGAAVQPQLSTLGRVQSSLADLQAKAQALKNFSNPPTFEDFKTLVQGFVQSVSNLNKMVNEVKQSALNGESRLGQALKEIQKAATGTSNTSTGALQKFGIDRQKDGTFSINQKTLEKSFQADRSAMLNTFSGVADRVGKAIDKQLSSSGFIGQKAQDLSARRNEVENSRLTIQDRLDTQKVGQQRLAAQLSNAGGYAARNAVTTYFNVASL